MVVINLVIRYNETGCYDVPVDRNLVNNARQIVWSGCTPNQWRDMRKFMTVKHREPIHLNHSHNVYQWRTSPFELA